ncbi:MAG: DRTGG domain-containing protein [Bacteroidales bacterium]
MTVEEVVKALNLRVISDGDAKGLKREVDGGYVSDLLSDVMGHAESEQIWITLQTHKNVMAIASLKELAAIILVKGLEPSSDMLEQSRLENIPILGTEEETFQTAGQLYAFLKLGNK